MSPSRRRPTVEHECPILAIPFPEFIGGESRRVHSTKQHRCARGGVVDHGGPESPRWTGRRPQRPLFAIPLPGLVAVGATSFLTTKQHRYLPFCVVTHGVCRSGGRTIDGVIHPL